MSVRISRDELYMRLANVFSLRSTCTRGQVGCVLVRDNHVIGAGYNGAPPHMPECLDVGCGGGVPDKPEAKEGVTNFFTFPNGCTRAIHAESNALAFSARHGVRTEGAVMYCTHAPCRACAQLMLSAGIAGLVFGIPYRDVSGIRLLEEAKVPTDQLIIGDC